MKKNIWIIAIAITLISGIAYSGVGQVIANYFYSTLSKTVLFGPPDRYISVGEGAGTAHGLDDAEDLLVEGDLEVKGTAYLSVVVPTPAPAFLGLTTLTYDGDDFGSYELAAAQCATDMADVAARVCSDDEVGKLIEAGDLFGGATDEIWVNEFAPSYTAFANDCDAWSSVAVGYYARYWNLNTRKAYLSGCGMAKKYACCK